MLWAAIYLASTLAVSGLESAVSSEGFKPGHHKHHKHKHKKVVRKHHRRHHSPSLEEEKTSRAHCVAWKDATYGDYPNAALYQHSDFLTKSEADEFFEAKRGGQFAAIQYAEGAQVDGVNGTYGSYYTHDAYKMALVCGISLNGTTPWSKVDAGVCDAGGVVDKMDECQLAGPFLGLTYSGHVSSDDGATPPGCHSINGESFYNMMTSVSFTGGSAAAICKATTTTTTPLPALTQSTDSLASSVEQAPQVVRRVSTSVEAGPALFHGGRHGTMTTLDHPKREDSVPTEDHVQVPPSLSGMPGLPNRMQPVSTEAKVQLPPSFRAKVMEPEPVVVKDPEADRAANAIKVLQDLQELKMQMEMKQMMKSYEKKMAGAATTTAAPVLKVETTAATTIAAAVLKVEPVSAIATTAAAALKVESLSAVAAPVLKVVTTAASTAAAPLKQESCKDKHQFCGDWAKKGECGKNPRYMKIVCKAACSHCG